MRLFAPFITAVASLGFLEAILASSHNSDVSAHRRRLGRSQSATNVSTRADNEGAVLEKRFSSARFSFFDTGIGACGKTNTRNDFIVALNQQQYGNGEHCFETITITYNGKTTQATIADKCMECPYGALDFTRGLFDFFGSESDGYLYGTWQFGSGEPKPTPTPSPTHTTTKEKPTPTPTPEPTTHSTTKTTTTSTHTTSSSSSSSVAQPTTTSSPTTSATATPSASVVPVPTDVLGQLNLAMVNLGAVFIGGVLIGAAAQ